ncbi:MAG: peptide chain release factor 1 [Deltaproteobacteria bacterium]|nr:peptide chain release factor 1 [Deltaproteobacteria bacterium]
MFAKVKDLEERFERLERELSRAEVIKDQKKYLEYTKEHSQLSPIINAFRELNSLKDAIEESGIFLNDSDPDIRRLAKEEINTLKSELSKFEKELQVLLLPKDPNDGKNIILEIRAGTGGDEAALFVADLFRMYLKYTELKRWKVEILGQNPIGIGGYKEIILLIEGKGVYSRLKHESGVHRVQRVPETETQGRIHTSAVTVAVLPEAEEVDVEINPDDIRIDTFRSSGCGGQHVNVTDSAIRITHFPSGLVVSCQDEKSQHKNKSKAMKVLRARLLDRYQAEQQSKISEERKNMVGSGDRSERIRTYNYSQGRTTEHRIGLTLYKLEDILQGQLDMIIEPLIAHFQAEALKGEL